MCYIVTLFLLYRYAASNYEAEQLLIPAALFAIAGAIALHGD